jgi:hypothetical protein
MSFGRHWLTPDSLKKIIKNKKKYTEADMPTAGSYIPGINRVGFGTSNVELFDINQDGLLDIVAGYWLSTTTLQMSSGFKVFINKGNCFNDETAIFFPNQRMNRDITPGAQSSYIHRFYFDDITGDNLPDLILQMDGYMDFLNSVEPYSPNVFVNNGSNVYLPLLKKNAIRHKIAPYKKQNYTDGGLKESLTNTFHSVGDFDGDGRADLAFIRLEHNLNDLYVMLQRSKMELEEERKRKDQRLKNINGYHEVKFNLKNEKVADALMVIKGNGVKFTNIKYSKTKFNNSLDHLNAYIEGGNILTLRSYNLGKFGYCLFLKGEVVFNNILKNTRYDYGMPGKEDCRIETNLWPISLKIGQYTSTEDYQKKQKAERQRKREILFSYDGTYKVQLGQNRNLIDGKMYEDLGSILFSLNRGVPKLDDNNILYKAFGLDEINFSLDYDGYMTISGLISSKLDTEQKCVYIAGNLKSDKEFIPQSSQNCRADGQNFLMKFEKISDDINFNFAQEEDLKELEGAYDVQWFITGINSTERSLYAKDTLSLSNGVGVFSGNEEDKQPSSELRKELSVQYNANGDIVILGPLDLMEKLDVKQWHASGKIHPNEKTTIKTIWGLGDIIELEIEKSKISKIPKSKNIQAKAYNYGDDFSFDEKNNLYQLNRLSEITGINQMDFSLSVDSDNEKIFNGDIAYSTSANNFETTWIDLKINETNEVSQNIKIGFVIEERSFPNFAESFSISKNECGVYEDMADDSFIIPLKTDNLSDLELFDCHVKALKTKLNEDDFGILRDRINTAISLVNTIEITNKYF